MTSSSSFEQLGIESWLCQQCHSLALHQPTPIQAQCIPSILAGRHVLGGAATGSGKTAAFALPILQILSKEVYGVFSVVLTPSRELGYQLADQFIALGAPLRLRTLLVMGGVSHNEQVEAIKTRPHLLLATPGRLCFLFRMFEQEVSQALRYMRFLVLDEADRLTEAEMGRDVRWLLQHHLRPTPRRQVLLFSATIHPRLCTTTTFSSSSASEPQQQTTKKRRVEDDEEESEEESEEDSNTSWLELLGITDVKTLFITQVGNADLHMNRAKASTLVEDESSLAKSSESSLSMCTSGETASHDGGLEDHISNMGGAGNNVFHIPKTLSNRYLFIPNVVKLPYLVATLRSFGKDQMTIVFVNSCVRAELVRRVLQLLGFPVCGLHSLLKQQQRLDALAMFKLGIAKIMVATDIAARGLDIPAVGVVLHYDVPKLAESFVHRVGRTARAGRTGLSVAFITECDVRLVKQLEKRLGTKLAAWTKGDHMTQNGEEKKNETEEEEEEKQEDVDQNNNHSSGDKKKKKEREKGAKKKKKTKGVEEEIENKLEEQDHEQGGAGTNDSHSVAGDSRGHHRRLPGTHSDKPAIPEAAVVKILDEVSEAKVTAMQQVEESLGRRAVTLKEQAAEKKASRREQQQQQQQRHQKRSRSLSTTTISSPPSVQAPKKPQKHPSSSLVAERDTIEANSSPTGKGKASKQDSLASSTPQKKSTKNTSSDAAVGSKKEAKKGAKKKTKKL